MNLIREWKNGAPDGKVEWLLELSDAERAALESEIGEPLTPQALGVLIDEMFGGEAAAEPKWK